MSSDVLLDWQIGSKQPPSVCLCCGEKFDGYKRKCMGPYYTMPYIWVCKECHDKPFLFFPDKKMEKKYITAPPLQDTMDHWSRPK